MTYEQVIRLQSPNYFMFMRLGMLAVEFGLTIIEMSRRKP